MTQKGKAEVRAGDGKADAPKLPKEAAEQLKLAQRIVQKYHDALRDITE